MSNNSKKKKTEEETVVMEDDNMEESEAVQEGMPERDQDPIIKDKSPSPDPLAKSIERQVTAMGRKTAEKLRSAPKEKIKIPLDQLNPNAGDVVVGVNGWNLQIQRGVAVNLPSPVVALLEQGGYNPTRVR